jgi:hypothetical protein
VRTTWLGSTKLIVPLAGSTAVIATDAVRRDARI